MRKKMVFGILCGIILLALGIRIYNLSSIAPGPHLDEVSNGYNAYSLLITGKDEYGVSWPILLQAYNDFRPALFVYTLIPFVKFLGLNIFAIRLPTVLLTVAATLSLYLLITLLLDYQKKKTGHNEASYLISEKNKVIVALAGAFLYAISPWSIYSSRFSNEINMSLSFFIFALTFFMLAIHKHKQDIKSTLSFFASIFFFVMAFYAYHGIKLFLPIFLLFLATIFFKELWERKKLIIIGALFGILLLVPLILAFQNPQTRLRLGAVNVFTKNDDILSLSSKRVLYDKTNHNITGQLFDNRRTLLFLEVAQNYLRNYDPSWLFSYVGNPSFQIPDFGPLYLFEFPLLLLGIFVIIKEPALPKKIKLLLLVWVLTATIPSAVSTESPQLNRSNPLLPVLIVVESFGLAFLIIRSGQLKNLYTKIVSFGILGGILAVSFLWFLHAYFILLPYYKAKFFQDGAVQALTYAKDHEDTYQTIIVANSTTLLDSYMYYLFLNKYDPVLYQKNGGTKSAFFTDEHFIDKYKFIDFNLYYGLGRYKKEKLPGKTLYIVNPSQVPQQIVSKNHIRLIKTIYFPDGTDAIWIMEQPNLQP